MSRALHNNWVYLAAAAALLGGDGGDRHEQREEPRDGEDRHVGLQLLQPDLFACQVSLPRLIVIARPLRLLDWRGAEGALARPSRSESVCGKLGLSLAKLS